MWDSFLQGPQKPKKPKTVAETAWAALQHLPPVPGYCHMEQECPKGSVCFQGSTATVALSWLPGRVHRENSSWTLPIPEKGGSERVKKELLMI